MVYLIADIVMAFSVFEGHSPIASFYKCNIYIRQVNGVNYGEICCDALIPSVVLSPSSPLREKEEVRLEPSTSHMGGQRVNHYTMLVIDGIGCITAFRS